MSNNHANESRDSQYVRPQLTVYGTVRNLTGGSTGTQNDGGGVRARTQGGGGFGSDPRFKENVVEVGQHPAGFGLYLFDYKAEFRDEFGHGRRFGVMADEIADIAPDAVITREDGYRLVDYGKIGVTLH
ncbi:tail fiber domain-containing protein [Aurantiacibacter spongiae]|uniref:Tail fiber domain-containing protein n=1 Tax=Aurantiacibacter spongiae TaxID=2488860 RepID=A0A3N5CR06_9SPHN|nr:tail fiber domain-containing protein [Aurantiacibacter spongiae]RPF71533.1 tail fiber domain-containing protein [Aurantiacibacter spongiae]